MRIQCIICQELFENRDDEVIAALDCGHTFHSACIDQWLENGNSCPSCRKPVNRKKIINRLYFDAAETDGVEVDSCVLTNQIQTLKLEVKKSESEKKLVIKERGEIIDKLKQAELSKKAVELELKEEKSKHSTVLNTLRYYKTQQTALQNEKKECQEIKAKLVNLKRCETLLSGCEAEAVEIISNTGDGPNAIQTLSRQLAFIKREYEKVKLEKKQFKENYEKLHLKESQKSRLLNELRSERDSLREQLDRSEGDLKLAEREVECLRRKADKFRKMLKSPDSVNTASSSFTNLLNESDHLNKFTVSTPKLTQGPVDLSTSPDLFTSPVKENIFKPSSQVEEDLDSKCNDVISRKRPLESSENTDRQSSNKVLKPSRSQSTGSQASSQLTGKLFRESTSKEPSFSLAGMNIFKKKTLGERSSITRKGYDGLGGHTTFVNTQCSGRISKPVGKKKLSKQSDSGAKNTLTRLGFSVM